jgi:hypothetical protein
LIHRGTFHKDGYSTTGEAFFQVGDQRLKVAKISRDTLTFSQPCELPPGVEGTLSVRIDGDETSRLISLEDGVYAGSESARYSTAAAV